MSDIVLIAPDGVDHKVIWIRQFCRDHGLDSSCITRVINGERDHHKGWRMADTAGPSHKRKIRKDTILPHGWEQTS